VSREFWLPPPGLSRGVVAAQLRPGCLQVTHH
jgi:hypothetical protein